MSPNKGWNYVSFKNIGTIENNHIKRIKTLSMTHIMFSFICGP